MSKIKKEKARFYFVWTKKGRVPRFTHTTREKAEKEAERLAALNPGKKFIVLEAQSKFSTSAPSPEPVAATSPMAIAA